MSSERSNQSREVKAIKVEGIEIDPPIMLAPMASLTTPSMRTVCEDMGCPFTFTEMVSVDGLVRRPQKLLKFIVPSFNVARSYGVQLVGRKKEEMAEAAKIAVDAGVSVIDLNMGCPARKVVSGGNGAALMKNPGGAGQIVENVVRAVGDRVIVTVKMRIGWDENSLNAPEIAKIAESAGARWVTVHGRTRGKFCSGPVNYSEIARVVDAVQIPVLGNGGIVDGESMDRMLEETGCAGVMIAQGALGNPWIFRELRAKLKGEEHSFKVTLNDRRHMMLRHFEFYMREGRDVARAVREMRKHLGWYSKGVFGGASFRRKIFRLTDPKDVVNHIETLGTVL